MESKLSPPPRAGAFAAGFSSSGQRQAKDERGGDDAGQQWPPYGQFPVQSGAPMVGVFNMANAHNGAAPSRLQLHELSGDAGAAQYGGGIAPPAPVAPAAPVTLPWGGTVDNFPPSAVAPPPTTPQSVQGSLAGASDSKIPAFHHPNAHVRTRQSPFTPTSASTPKDSWHPTAHIGRYSSPLYGKNRKRVSSNTSSVMTDDALNRARDDFNDAASVSSAVEGAEPGGFWQTEDSLLDDTKSEDGADDVSSVFSDRQSVSSVQFTTSSRQHVGATSASSYSQNASSFQHGEQPQTPSGSTTLNTSEENGGLSASQRGRMGTPAYTALGSAKSRSNSSENLFSRNYVPPPYDESKSGPMSAPPALDALGKQPFAGPRGSLTQYPHYRSSEVIASKLLPSKSSVNSLMGYVRELQLSEATLREQLVKSKKTSEIELTRSLSKMTSLEKSIHEIEAEKEEAKRKLEEQERLIQQLAAKLREVEQQQQQQQQLGLGAIPEDAPISESHGVTASAQPHAEETTSTEEVPITSEAIGYPDRNEYTAAELTEQSVQEDQVAHFDGSATYASDNVTEAATVTADSESAQSSGNYVDNAAYSTPTLTGRRSLPPLQTEETLIEGDAANSTEQFAEVSAEDAPADQPSSMPPTGVMSPLSPTPLPWNPWGSGGGSSSMYTAPPAFSVAPTMGVDLPATPVQPAEAQETQAEGVGDNQQGSVPESVPAEANVGTYEEYQENRGETPQEDVAPTPVADAQPEMYAPPPFVAPSPVAQYPTDGLSSSYPSSPMNPTFPAPVFTMGAIPPMDELYPPQSVQPAADVAAVTEEQQAPVPPSSYNEHAFGGIVDQSQQAQAQYTDDSQVYNTVEPTPESAEVVDPVAVAPPVGPPTGLPVGPPTEPPVGPPLAEPASTVNGPPVEPPTGPPLGPRTGPPSGPPPAAVPSPSSPSASQPTEAAPSTEHHVKDAAYLESILTDFFTEFDKKKLKMAEVYAKRYFGREKWLFTELTRRYGKDKVAGLRARYESADGSVVPTEEHSSSGAAPATTPTRAASKHPHHQFLSRPQAAHASETQLSNDEHSAQYGPPPTQPPIGFAGENGPPTGTPPPVDNNADANGHEQHDANSEVTEPTATESVDQSRGLPPPPMNEPPRAVSDGPPMMSAYAPPKEQSPPKPRAARVSPRMQRRKSPFGQFPSANGNAPPMPHHPMNGEGQGRANENTEATANATMPPPPPVGAPAQINPPASTGATEAVTLENLLMELYRKHQPDKIKNVPVVAREYAGKERELVRLLKGKYGALSVKRLEENLPSLEQASRKRKAATSKSGRGCLSCSIVLVIVVIGVLWMSILSVFAGVAVIDSYECQSIADEDVHAVESSDECAILSNELGSFSHSRVGDYVRQTHSNACFCAEWKKREASVSTSMSVEDALELVKLLPFSPADFGSSWVALAKDQTPVYEMYASPLVQLTLDIGSLFWSDSKVSDGKSAQIIKSTTKLDDSRAKTEFVSSSDDVLTKVAMASKSLANLQSNDAVAEESVADVSSDAETASESDAETASELESDSSSVLETEAYEDVLVADVGDADDLVEVVVEQEGFGLKVEVADELEAGVMEPVEDVEIEEIAASVDEESADVAEEVSAIAEDDDEREPIVYMTEEDVSSDGDADEPVSAVDNDVTDPIETADDESSADIEEVEPTVDRDEDEGNVADEVAESSTIEVIDAADAVVDTTEAVDEESLLETIGETIISGGAEEDATDASEREQEGTADLEVDAADAAPIEEDETLIESVGAESVSDVEAEAADATEKDEEAVVEVVGAEEMTETSEDDGNVDESVSVTTEEAEATRDLTEDVPDLTGEADTAMTAEVVSEADADAEMDALTVDADVEADVPADADTEVDGDEVVENPSVASNEGADENLGELSTESEDALAAMAEASEVDNEDEVSEPLLSTEPVAEADAIAEGTETDAASDEEAAEETTEETAGTTDDLELAEEAIEEEAAKETETSVAVDSVTVDAVATEEADAESTEEQEHEESTDTRPTETVDDESAADDAVITEQDSSAVDHADIADVLYSADPVEAVHQADENALEALET